MVTLHVLQLLQDNGFGTMHVTGTETSPETLFVEQLPTGKTGIAIFSRGASMSRGTLTTQAFDVYSRGTSNVLGYTALEAVQQFFIDNYAETCTLPAVAGVDDKTYTNVTIEPISNIENAGTDVNDRVVYTMTAQVTYNQE